MRQRPPRGFTLIELMIALAMALAVTASAVSVMVLAVKTQQQGILRNGLARDAQLVMDTVGRDLSYLGAGVPRGFESTPNGMLIGIGESTFNATTAQLNGQASRQLRPAIRIGLDDYIAFIGDAPYPNAELNGIMAPGVFQDDGSPKNDELQLTSELSPCGAPNTSGDYDCQSTSDTFVQNLGGSNCDGSNTGEPTCPWGMNKIQVIGGTNPTLIFSGVDGSWFRRRWDMATFSDEDGRLLAHLDHVPTSSAADLPMFRFQESGVGGAMVAHLDRIFYSLEETGAAAGTVCSGDDCTLHRRQCWGWTITSDNPNAATFPSVGASALRSDASPLRCTAPAQGTPWEPLMADISLLQFAYFAADDLGTALTTALDAQSSAKTRVIEVQLEMKRKIPGTIPAAYMTHRLTRRFWLENAGGLVTFPSLVAEASGGCYQSSALPNECNPQ